ncbi:hypothetical protein PFICI_14947 [Pestalotiopsis fici W106-1]|uniref:Uncharacterized protein n=1 Tax=Pestalotiopsis fici (strain W106-1 / CGMCC3.15140) TaxID=1229662 RepID=W3WJN4_PESFW|nr:uncharacterized protein PFICI_14947 [Pestalotiopsis fici W106-1]ETS73342.1 hypothetical protein PFICI_14947 [Pestalotiopsis fici W106-1]
MSGQSLDRFRGRQRGNERVTSLRQRFEESAGSAGPSSPQDSNSSHQRTMLTGEQRIPLRDRLVMIKARVAAASSSASSPFSTSSFSSSDGSRPATPQQQPKTPDYCPPEPRQQPRSRRKIRERVSAERLHASSCDYADIMLDRRANDVGDCDDWFAYTEKALPCLPLAIRRRSPLHNSVMPDWWDQVSFSDFEDQEDGEEGTGAEMRRHLNTFHRGNVNVDHGKQEFNEERLKSAYVNGRIDGTLADLNPCLISVIEENRKKIDDKGSKGASSADEMMSYLYGAIDQELPAWESQQRRCENDPGRILRM